MTLTNINGDPLVNRNWENEKPTGKDLRIHILNKLKPEDDWVPIHVRWFSGFPHQFKLICGLVFDDAIDDHLLHKLKGDTTSLSVMLVDNFSKHRMPAWRGCARTSP